MTKTTENRHPIGVVAKRTGLSPDVLRVWERRYGVVVPGRSAGGQRLYSDADIVRLTLLNRAARGGHGISNVAGLSNEELARMSSSEESVVFSGSSSAASSALPHGAIAEAVEMTRQLDPGGLERLLRKNVARYGLVGFLDAIAGPFLRAVGDAWHEGSCRFRRSILHWHR